MAEYIEREAFRDELLNISIDISNLYGCGVLEGLDRATKRLNEQPAADVAPVVRCKDCLYSTERYGHMECMNGVSYRNTWNKPDFYCAYGEQKGGDD